MNQEPYEEDYLVQPTLKQEHKNQDGAAVFKANWQAHFPVGSKLRKIFNTGADLGGVHRVHVHPPQENISEQFITIHYLQVVLTVGVPVCDVGNWTSNIEMLLSLVVRASLCEYNKLASQV